MKPITRIFVLILSLCMLVSVASINSFAAAEDIMMTVSDTEAELGDKIEVTISNKEVTFRGLTLKLSFDTSIVKCVEMYNVDGDDGDFEELYMYYYRPNGKLKDMYPDVCDTIELTNSDGKFQYGMVPGDDTKFADGDIVKLVFEVIGEGQFTFDLEKVIVDADGEVKVNHTFDVTIKSATPACDHANQNFRYVSNSNGTHNVVCNDCGTATKENVTCTVDESKTNYGEKMSANCCEAGDRWKYTFCVCEYGFSAIADNGSIPATGKHTLVHVPARAADCLDPGHKEYWRCDQLGYTFSDAEGKNRVDESWVEKGGEGYLAPDKSNHVYTDVTYIDITDTHHTLMHSCCGATEDPATHTYDAETHVCECEAVETFEIYVTDLNRGYFSYCINVPYGAVIMDYIPADVNNDSYYEKNSSTIGHHKFGGWVVTDMNMSAYTGTTMPADTLYISAEDLFTGWQKVNGDQWYYQVDGQTQKGGWTEIFHEDYLEDGSGSDWYYLQAKSGWRATGVTRVSYPTETINGITYGPNTEDKEYAEKNADSKYTDAETAVFVFDENGVFQSDFTGIVNDVETVRYAVNGMIGWHPGFVTVDNELYYFVADETGRGNKAANGIVYVTRGTGADTYMPGYISFVNGMVDTEYTGIAAIKDNKFYFENGVCVTGKGIVEINEKVYIYVRSGGQLAVGDYWVASDKANGVLDGGKLYNFGTDGILTIDPNKNGLIDGVYYKEGIPYYAGLIEDKGHIYYVKSNGEVVTDAAYYVTKTNGMEGFKPGDKLVFGEDGKMEPIKNGVFENAAGALCFYKNNQIQYAAGLIEWEGDIYYVRSNGQIATGEYCVTNTNGMDGFTSGMKLVFDDDGKLIEAVN